MTLDPLHFVNVGAGGTFRPSGDLASTQAQVDALMGHLESAAVSQVVLHFHGGLVSESAGVAVATKLHPTYADIGAHPVFFVWETGIGETLQSNLTGIYQTSLFQKLMKTALRFAAKKLGVGPEGARSAAAPAMTDAEVELELADSRFTSFDAIARGASERIDPAKLPQEERLLVAELELELAGDPELEAAASGFDESTAPDAPLRQELVGPEGAKGAMEIAIAVAKYLARVVIAVVRRYLAKTAHDFYPTVVEELLRAAYLANLGKWMWDGMKAQAAAMWTSNAGVAGLDQHPGRYFLERFSELQRRTGVTLELVGHSAGSIAIGHLLDVAATTPAVQVGRVALLAPAIRSDQFLRQYVNVARARFEDVRVFTMTDAHERSDALVPVIYPRSLLYLVSGVFEDAPGTPLLGLARYWDDPPQQSDAIHAVRQWLLDNPRSRAMSVSDDQAPPGYRTASTSHGGFDDDPLTRESLACYLRR